MIASTIPTALAVTFQPALVEAVVLLETAGHADEHEFRRARDRLYDLPEDERDDRFTDLHLRWFERLGCAAPVLTAIAELQLLARHCGRCVVTQAPRARDEGADLLVAPGTAGAAGRTVAIRLRPGAFTDPNSLLALLRGELLHVADMLDPTFAYDPALPVTDGGPTYERMLRERYRVLWNVSVAGRLDRRGVAHPQARALSERAFRAAFPMLGEESNATFRRFFDDQRPTHAQIIAFAVTPRGRGPTGLHAGARCPLCRFPTYAAEPSPETLPDDVVACIAGDFPAWNPEDGLCRQCADLYRSRGMSAAAAARLPGRQSDGCDRAAVGTKSVR